MTIFFFDFFIQNAFFYCFDRFFIFLLMFCAATTNKTTTFIQIWFIMIISKSYFSFVNSFFTVSFFMLIVLTFFFANATDLKSKCETIKNAIWKIARNWTKIDDNEKIISLNFFEIITQSRWLRSIHMRTWNVSSRWNSKHILLSYIWIRLLNMSFWKFEQSRLNTWFFR